VLKEVFMRGLPTGIKAPSEASHTSSTLFLLESALGWSLPLSQVLKEAYRNDSERNTDGKRAESLESKLSKVKEDVEKAQKEMDWIKTAPQRRQEALEEKKREEEAERERQQVYHRGLQLYITSSQRMKEKRQAGNHALQASRPDCSEEQSTSQVDRIERSSQLHGAMHRQQRERLQQRPETEHRLREEQIQMEAEDDRQVQQMALYIESARRQRALGEPEPSQAPTRRQHREVYAQKMDGWFFWEDSKILDAIRKPPVGGVDWGVLIPGRSLAETTDRARTIRDRARQLFEAQGRAPPKWCYHSR
jgi:hypothetical protein